MLQALRKVCGCIVTLEGYEGLCMGNVLEYRPPVEVRMQVCNASKVRRFPARGGIPGIGGQSRCFIP